MCCKEGANIANYKSNFSSIENKVNELSYIDIIDKYDFRELNYNLIITDRQNLDSISNFDGLIFNIEDKEDNFSTIKNLVNLVSLYDIILIVQQFINNPKWNFYYKSVEKSNVKFIYDLFSTCNSYNKIVSSEIKFHKIE